MRKITKYVCCWGSTSLELEKDVNGLISEGFEPFGGVVISSAINSVDEIYGRYAQAMVMYA